MEELFPTEKKLVTRISKTPRGAIFKLRQAVYSIIRSQQLDVESSRDNWRRAVSEIIETLEGINDPCRVELTYVISHDSGKSVFKPLKFKVEIYQKVREIEKELKE